MPICPHITRWSFIVKLILQFRWKLKRDLLSTILNWRYGMFVSFSYIINNPITFQKRFIAICSIISCKYDHLQYQTFEARERDVSITIFQNSSFCLDRCEELPESLVSNLPSFHFSPLPLSRFVRASSGFRVAKAVRFLISLPLRQILRHLILAIFSWQWNLESLLVCRTVFAAGKILVRKVFFLARIFKKKKKNSLA